MDPPGGEQDLTAVVYLCGGESCSATLRDCLGRPSRARTTAVGLDRGPGALGRRICVGAALAVGGGPPWPPRRVCSSLFFSPPALLPRSPSPTPSPPHPTPPTPTGCGAKNHVKPQDQIRCRSCGYRILYKVRTKRMVQHEAR